MIVRRKASIFARKIIIKNAKQRVSLPFNLGSLVVTIIKPCPLVNPG